MRSTEWADAIRPDTTGSAPGFGYSDGTGYGAGYVDGYGNGAGKNADDYVYCAGHGRGCADGMGRSHVDGFS